MKQADDFLAECAALHDLLDPLGEADFGRETLFKSWTVDEILRHLMVWNRAAELSLTGGGFDQLMTEAGAFIKAGGTLRGFEAAHLTGLSGKALLALWREEAERTGAAYAGADPSQRIQWVGPPMSARASITARQMETWAHGQAVFDMLGAQRQNTDRIENIVFLGVKTYGWSFQVNGETPPEPAPHLVLTAPSGTVWTYNPPSETERIEGLAEEFCQVAAQTRNIADTGLRVVGETAQRWMAIAQCFAGPAEPPPPPGLRRIQTKEEA